MAVSHLPPPLSARTVMPLTWSLVSSHEHSVLVSVSIPAPNGNALMTSEVSIVRDSWEVWHVDGPEVDETDLELLADDVRRYVEGSGSRYAVDGRGGVAWFIRGEAGLP